MSLLSGRFECPRCGSSDGLAHDDTGGDYCFSCETTCKVRGDGPDFPMTTGDEEFVTDLAYHAIGSRGISAETCKRYGYAVGTYGGESVQIANHYTETGAIKGQQIRFRDKRFVIIGDVTDLYGRTRMRDAGKMIVITEGELDCLAVSEVLGNRWPVVSIPSGVRSARKAIKAQIGWLEKFDRVVLCFDQDDPGRKAMESCRDLFSPGKLKIAVLPRKDPCEMVAHNERDKLIDCIWNAPTWMPGGILTGRQVLEAALSPKPESVGGWPWPLIDSILDGLRYTELITLCAGTGIGKSTVCRELAAHMLSLGETVGYIALEEHPRTSALGIYGVHCNTPLRREMDEAKVQAAHADWGDRLVLFDHFGSTATDELLLKLRYMIKALNCRILFVDHISILISGLEVDDERRAIDMMMTRLRELVQETGVLMVLVSHLKRSAGRGHELGGEVSLDQLRGSQAIAQLSDTVIGMERNQQDDDADERDALVLRVLKCRETGKTGKADILQYNHDTGRLAVRAYINEFTD